MPACASIGMRSMALLEDRLEMLEVLGQLVEAEILGDAVHAPGLGHRLEGAEQQLAGILLVVGAFVRHPQHRQVARQAGDRLGDDVEMLAGVQRHGDADRAGELARPHAGAVHDDVGSDGALLGHRRRRRGPCSTTMRVDLDALEDARAALRGRPWRAPAWCCRVRLAVLRQVHAADRRRRRSRCGQRSLDLGRRAITSTSRPKLAPSRRRA